MGMRPPNWDVEPMKVGDQWAQDNRNTVEYSEDWSAGGDLSGSGSKSGTYYYIYDFTWQVASMASKTINNIMGGGNNNFPEAYKLVRTGSYVWEHHDGVNVEGGTVNTGPYEKWYANDGDVFDACWDVEYNQTTRMIWSTCVAFVNNPPEITSPPPSEVDIYEDELWEFTNGQDYAVSDSDPGEAGELEYTISAKLGTDTHVLTGLDIDSKGKVSFTPTQADVADGYEITITVWDKYDKDPMSIDVAFTLNVKNSNDAPTADLAVIEDLVMDEGERKDFNWKLGDVFKDPDMAPNPLNANQPYDPNERLVFSAINNGSIRLLCPNGLDLGPSNQCDAISFEAMDRHFPRDTPVQLTIKATDAGTLFASDQVLVTVEHVNHAPGGEDISIEADEDETVPLFDLKDMFVDPDVNDAGYATDDSLAYSFDKPTNMKVTISGSRAKIELDQDWYGEETISFTAKDRAGATAKADMKVMVSPINDAPKIDSFTPASSLEIMETSDGTEDGKLTTFDLSVVTVDVDGDILKYTWTVEDDDTAAIFAPSDTDGTLTFKATFDGDFVDGNFHGGKGSKTYKVVCRVTDPTGASDETIWYIEVENVNRAPKVEGEEAFKMGDGGLLTGLPPKTVDTYALAHDKVYRFDATNRTLDLDEGHEPGIGIDGVTFEWTSDKQGVLGTGPYLDLGVGKTSSHGIRLKPGLHTITIRVTDDDGSTDEFSFQVKVQQPPEPTIIPGFAPYLAVAAIIVVAIALIWRKGRH